MDPRKITQISGCLLTFSRGCSDHLADKPVTGITWYEARVLCPLGGRALTNGDGMGICGTRHEISVLTAWGFDEDKRIRQR